MQLSHNQMLNAKQMKIMYLLYYNWDEVQYTFFTTLWTVCSLD